MPPALVVPMVGVPGRGAQQQMPRSRSWVPSGTYHFPIPYSFVAGSVRHLHTILASVNRTERLCRR